MHIVIRMSIDSQISCRGIVRRSFNQADAAPVWQVFGRDVGPILAAIAGDVDQSIVRAHPDQTLLQGRLCHGEDGVVILRTGIVFVDWTAGDLLLSLIVAREVGLIASQCMPPSVVLKRRSPAWYRVLGSCGEIRIGAVHWKRCSSCAAPPPSLISGCSWTFFNCPLRLSKRVITPSYSPA